MHAGAFWEVSRGSLSGTDEKKRPLREKRNPLVEIRLNVTGLNMYDMQRYVGREASVVFELD
jgi:hypothetical protein